MPNSIKLLNCRRWIVLAKAYADKVLCAFRGRQNRLMETQTEGRGLLQSLYANPAGMLNEIRWPIQLNAELIGCFKADFTRKVIPYQNIIDFCLVDGAHEDKRPAYSWRRQVGLPNLIINRQKHGWIINRSASKRLFGPCLKGGAR